VKEAIQNTATNLFLRLGFKSVTMDDIAEEMGISKKTIYAHYSNKSQLIEGSVWQLMEEINTGIESLRAQNLNPIVENFEVKVYVQRMLKNEKTSPQFQLKKYYPKIYNTISNKKFEVAQRSIIDNLERGIRSGYYRSNISISFVSRLHFAGMLGVKDKNLFPEDEFSNNKLMDYLLEYHLRAICTPKGLEVLEDLLTKNKVKNEI
jgi:AcrR family transcriptional regulator